MNWYKIDTDGTVTKLDKPDNDLEQLHVLQEAVGGFIEVMPNNFYDNESIARVFINEEGKLLKLSVNEPAMDIIDTNEPIVGNIVVESGVDILNAN